jgi:Carboxylesterase family
MRAWTASVNCDAAADVLACLRAVPADTLMQTSINTTETGWPNIEPSVLPEDPFSKLRRLGSPVPLLIGSNSDELAFTYIVGPALDPAATPPASTRNPEFRPRRAWRPKTIGLVVSERSWRLQRRAPPQLIGRIDPHGGHRSAGRVQLADRDVRASRPKSSVGSNCSRECRDPRTARAGANAPRRPWLPITDPA